MKKWIIPALVFGIILSVFNDWFVFLPLSTGDWVYKYPEQIRSFQFHPYAWKENLNYGFGANGIFIIALDTYFSASIAFLNKFLNLPWVLIERIVWFWPFLLISSVGPFIFFKKFILNNNNFASISSLIFTANTYVLMVTSGGQMGIAMSYALIPFVFYAFLNLFDSDAFSNKNFRKALIAGVVFSAQLLLDLRIAYITLIFIGIYWLINLIIFNKSIIKSLPLFVISGIVAFFLHFFWIVPFLISGQNPLAEFGAQYSTSGIVEYLSFGKFENTVSLLHPNWPENLFGKAYFMRPEFLMIPILAFTGLIFLRSDKSNKIIPVFSLIALIAAFLAKGTNDPFGMFYTFAFENIPGFQMLRDPTKWYVIIAFSFSLLIPYTLYCLSKLRFFTKTFLIIFAFLIFWIITIRQVFIPGLSGTFIPEKEPASYVEFSDFISNKTEFFRTLWVPTFHQYSYFSEIHPAVPAADFFSRYTSEEIAGEIGSNLGLLAESGIKYIVVPEDNQGKIFTDDRKYNERIYRKTVEDLTKIKGISEAKKIGKIVYFEIPDVKDRIWSPSKNLSINYNRINPSLYEVNIKAAVTGDMIIFAEKFDKRWKAKNNEFEIGSVPYKSELNSFILPKAGNYNLRIEYGPQRWVDLALFVSSGALILIISYLVWYKLKK